VESGDEQRLRELAAASALARAADFSGKLPLVSNKYLEYADSLSHRDYHDREMSMRCQGAEGLTTHEVRKAIALANADMSRDDEHRMLDALGLSASDEELDRFMTHPWRWEEIVFHDRFAASLPQAWR
jgi:hypothetical protein